MRYIFQITFNPDNDSNGTDFKLTILEFDNCIVCENNEFTKFKNNSKIGMPVYICSSCGLIVAGKTHKERKEISNRLYANEYWDTNYEKYQPNEDYTDVASLGKKRDFDSQYSYIKKHSDDFQRCLEIGAGTGTTLYWLEQLGCDVIGIEPDKRNTQMINKKLQNGKCINSNGEEFTPNGMFELIWINHVLEHSLRPDKIIKNMVEHLTDKGLIMIEVPNCENPNILHESMVSNPDNWHFTADVLKSLIKKLGLRLVSIDYFRPAKKSEGMKNKIFRKINKSPYPYYPRIQSDSKKGIAIRMLVGN